MFQNGEYKKIQLNTKVAYTDDLISTIKRFAIVNYIKH